MSVIFSCKQSSTNASFSLKNIDHDALCEGLRLEDEDALKTVAGQISLSIHTLGPNIDEVMYAAHQIVYYCLIYITHT